GGAAPDFFADGGEVPPAVAERCRMIVSGCRELFAAPAALGWFHQFWQGGERAGLSGRTRGDQCAKIGAATVAPATQVFSEEYMVAFLAENSLGSLWLDMHPASPLAAGWRYYVHPPAARTAGRLSVREITVCDPACGAGNFLLAAFDLLYDMYREEEGGDPAEICAAIVNGNLFGMDIDARAAAVARASLWLRAREKAPDLDPAVLTGLYGNIVAGGGELGSLLTAEEAPGPLARLLARRYTVVVANPPYLDKRDYAKSVRAYLRRHYAAGAGNLYAAFILRCLGLAERYVAMVTPQTFLFIRSYAVLRREVFGLASVRTLAHLGLGAFADAVVDVALFVLEKGPADSAGVYFKLLAAQRKAEALAAAVGGHNAGEARPEVFVRPLAAATALTGGPLAYWLGEGLGAAVAAARPLQEAADVVLGMKTADNTRFVRRWWEVWQPGVGTPGWVPYEKEASGFRYARPAAHYVRWTEGAQEFYRTHYSAQLPNPRYWFREGIVYGLISSKAFAAKLLPAGYMTDMAASCVFPRDRGDTPFLLGLLNAKIYRWLLKMFNPTVNYQPVDLQRLPLPTVAAGERGEIGRLALIAAAAASTLRAAEITDRGFLFAPDDWLPLAEKLPRRTLGLWLAALRYVLAVDAIDRCLAAALSLPDGEAAAIAAELGGSPSGSESAAAR
ncbi:MAG TPA: DNA methyltransferase, partial [Negativicutes bacterium]|nr:DNA methyltransferase [Negativicutes bacterium]